MFMRDEGTVGCIGSIDRQQPQPTRRFTTLRPAALLNGDLTEGLPRLQHTKPSVAQQWGGQGAQSLGSPAFRANLKKNNFLVTVKIRTSGYQTLECFIATLPT